MGAHSTSGRSMNLRARVAAEGRDLALLAACALAVPLVWLTFGWRPGFAAASHDGLLIFVPHLKALLEAGGEWRQAVYRTDWIGGVKVQEVAGDLPALALFYRLGLSLNATLNAVLFLTQALYAFLGLRAARDLARVWGANPGSISGHAPGLFLLLAFAPVLGWLLGHGHHGMVSGNFSLIATWALLAAAAGGTLTVTLAAAAAAGIAHGLPWAGVHTFLCGVIFGAPLLFAAAWGAARVRPRGAVLALAAAAAAVLFCLPRFGGMLAHAVSSDAARGLGGPQVVWSYVVSTPRDWLTSIPWSREWPAAFGRPLKFHHETNIPWGPLLLLLIAVPRRGRSAAWAWGLGAAAAVFFSMNFRPVSGPILALVPALGDFRVPQHAALPLAMALPILAGAVILNREAGEKPAAGRRPAALAVALGAACFWGPPWLREPLGWLIALALARPSLARRTSASPGALSAALGLAGLGAFRERLPAFRDLPAAVASAAGEGASILSLRPDLASPLARVRVEPPIPDFGNNTAFMMGLSSLDGYFFAPRRFLALAAALAGKPYIPVVNNFNFALDSAALAPLSRLYNVRALVARGEGGTLIHDIPGGAAAWFGLGPRGARSFDDLAAGIKSLDPARLRREIWVLGSDPAVVRAGLPGAFPEGCARAEIKSLAAWSNGAALAEVASPARCPLVFAMNYVENLVARGGASGEEALVTFPAYGSLLGVVAPAGSSRIKISAEPSPPPWAPRNGSEP